MRIRARMKPPRRDDVDSLSTTVAEARATM
jgi:hypothetical protein